LRLIFAKMAGYPEHMTQSKSISSGERGRVLASLV